MFTLHTYWRSSAAYRVRIALNYKNIAYQSIPVHLIKDGGEQHSEHYQKLNPNELVPTLEHDGLVLNQSIAILEYIEAFQPSPSLLPGDISQQAHIRAFALDVAADIHPLNNLRVTQFLQGKFDISDEQTRLWYHHWLHAGFKGLEKRLRHHSGRFCFGNAFSMADVCLIPQVYNALRFKLDMTMYSNINRIYGHCISLDYVSAASPEKQDDAPSS